MKTRNATIDDAKDIYSLISSYAERDQMLFRSVGDIYENIQSFIVAEVEGQVVGCCALQVIWADLVEIKSLVVKQESKKKGIGKMLVCSAIERAEQINMPRIFVLTLTTEFFEKLGFEKIDRDSLPMKVWSDCAKCPKQQNCDEIALIKQL